MAQTYEQFIQNIITTRGQNGCLTEYFEKHHIVPRCCGGCDSQDNLVELLPEEHYIAHKLLAEENPDNLALQQAFACMSFMKKDHYKVTPEEFAEARRAQARASSVRMSVTPGVRKGVPHSEETKQKIREANKNYKPTEEARRKQSEAQKGRKQSEETKKKIRDKLKGRTFDEDFRKKCSIAKLGNQNAKGHGLTPEAKEKIRQTKKANGTDKWTEKHYETVKRKQENNELHWTLAEETKQRISEARKGIVFSEEHRKNMSKAQKGIPKPNSGKYERTPEIQWKIYKKKFLHGPYFSDPHSPHKGESITAEQLNYVIHCLSSNSVCDSTVVPQHFIDAITRLISRLGPPDMEEAQEVTE